MVRLDSGSTVYVFNLCSYRLIAAIHFTPNSRAGVVSMPGNFSLTLNTTRTLGRKGIET